MFASQLPPAFRTPPRASFRRRRLWGWVLALAVVLGCQAESPTAPEFVGEIPASGIAGLVKAPPVMHKDNAGNWDSVRGPLYEPPLTGVAVYLYGARGETLDVPPAITDDKGIFVFDSVPVEAGLVAVMPKASEAYKPLLAYYRRGRVSYVGVASTTVAGALQKAIAENANLTFAAFDPDKIDDLQKKAEAKIAQPTTAFSLHYLDVLLFAWAKGDQGIKGALEALSPGITAPKVEATPPGLKQKT